jgi:zinc protease
VQVTLVIDGGSRLDSAQPGLAGFSARMLTEAAGTRDANALQSELAFIGATLNTGALADAFIVSLNVPKRSLGAALDLMADVALRPQFRAADVRRQRELALAGILQRKDQPTQLASLAFNQLIFPAGHPYHNSSAGDSATIASVDSARVRAFYKSTFVPSRAKFVVVGDVGKAEIEALLAARFGAWKSDATPLPIPSLGVQPNANGSTQLYLIDKPGAAQSVIYVGNPGADRLGPDYPAISVMNTILGGSFSARLMSNLRETKGYTYGVSSSFRWAPVPGPFAISSSVRTNVTDSSLVEIFKELQSMRDTPVSAVELDRAKAYIALALPARFETNAEIAGQLVDLGTYGLPLSSVPDFGAKVNAVTAADVQRVARQYMQADRETIVVVGDLAKVRSGIEALKLGTITVLDVSAVAR